MIFNRVKAVVPVTYKQEKKVICYPSSSKATPIIVAGPPRSATRFVANVLNSIPGVTINSEIPVSVMDKLVDLVRKSNNIYTSDLRENVAESWDQSKRDFMYAAWANLAKGRRKKTDKDCMFYGYKSPLHEKYFYFYNAFFDPVRPRYVCCVRPFLGHYFSVQARWPERSIAKVAYRYVASLDWIRRMKQERPDDVLLFFLDDYKVQGFSYLCEKIFEPLGLKDLARAEIKAAEGPANTADHLGVKKRDRLSARQSLFLRIYPQPLEKYEALHRDFG